MLSISAFRSLLLGLATFGAAYCPAASASEPWRTYSDGQLLDYYQYIAFGAEAASPEFYAAIGNRIFKRDQRRTVKVVILPQPSVSLGDPSLLEVKSVLEDIVQHSGGIRVHVISWEELATYMRSNTKQEITTDSMIIFLGNREELTKQMEKGAQNKAISMALGSGMRNEAYPFCAAANAGTQDGSRVWIIQFSMVFIEMSGALRECLYEEMMQAFGLSRDFPDGVPSLFSDDRVYRAPTDLDWIIWRIHTDPEIVSGMDAGQARAAASKLLVVIRDEQPSPTP